MNWKRGRTNQSDGQRGTTAGVSPLPLPPRLFLEKKKKKKNKTR